VNAPSSVPRRRLLVAAVLAVLLAGGWALVGHGSRSVEAVTKSLDGSAGARVREALARAGAPAHPSRFWLVAVKDEKRLDLWAETALGQRVFVRSWSVLAASGTGGPKLREGDRQVPEGVYRIVGLNPNSAYHLSLKVDYPNAMDRAWAARDGRTGLGGDIFIHGKDVSIGCLAIGDAAVEELFWLAATEGREAFTVVIVPTDLRRNPPPTISSAWAPDLYRSLRDELERFPATHR
jgi:hypothetical protein